MSVFGRIAGTAVVAAALVACGNTTRSPVEMGEGGAQDETNPPPRAGGGASANIAGAAGSLSDGGSSAMTAGGEDALGASGAGAAPDCIEGAACLCDDSTGTLDCGGAAASAGGQCVCPPESECRAPSGTCFEPCGGDALGLWVLEKTCFPGAETGQGCAGGAIEGTSSVSDLKLLVLENEPVSVFGSEEVELRAQVPLRCLGIDSVNRCKDAQFYASPLFFGASNPLDCQPSDCGFCECSGKASGGGGAQGAAWVPGSSTLAFGAIDLPYCVDGDVLWVGGGTVAGEPRVAYQFRRRSCLGTPTPCEQRQSDQCGSSGDCQPGRCLPDGESAPVCAELPLEESCSAYPGCKWAKGGCWGTAPDACDYRYCDGTPGCSWGTPTARCGGEPAGCYTHDASDCNVAGCSARKCDVPDGWAGIDQAPCQGLAPSACAKAKGCTVSGASCTGTTTCAAQTDPTVCADLGCAAYDEPICGGHPTTLCSKLSVDDCRSEPGCRLEW